jgi:hypothetical protein
MSLGNPRTIFMAVRGGLTEADTDDALLGGPGSR